MGFFDQLKGAGRALFDDLDKTFGKVTTVHAFTRVCQAAYLIARADGTIDNSEKATLQKVIAKKFPHFKGADIAKAIADADDELSFTVDGGVQMLLGNIAKSAGTDEAAVIMVAVLAVANADGNFDDSEKAMAKQIASRLGLTPSDYGL